MGTVVPHATPSGASGSWWGRFNKHAGPNGPRLRVLASGNVNGDNPESGRHTSGKAGDQTACTPARIFHTRFELNSECLGRARHSVRAGPGRMLANGAHGVTRPTTSA